MLGTLVDRDTECCTWDKFGLTLRQTAGAEGHGAGSSLREPPGASLCGGGLRLVILEGGPLVGRLPGGRVFNGGSASWHPDLWVFGGLDVAGYLAFRLLTGGLAAPIYLPTLCAAGAGLTPREPGAS